MKSIQVAFWAEALKIRKSKVFWISILFFVFISFMMGIVVMVQQNPELTEKIGLLGTKASLMKFGEPSWENYFTLLLQVTAGIGMVGYGFFTCWVFGQEFTENTIKDIIALPVSRSSIVMSKLLVVALWSIIVTIVFGASGTLFGYWAGLNGLTIAVLQMFVNKFMGISLLTILLITPVAFFVCYSKGILLPIGLVILTMIMANFTGLLGAGPYFPWAIPGMLSVSSSHLSYVSYIILFFTSIVGLLATFAWWQWADQK